MKYPDTEEDVVIPLSFFEKKQLKQQEHTKKNLEKRQEFLQTCRDKQGYYDNEGYFTKIYRNTQDDDVI